MTAIPSLVERLDELIERLGSIPKFVITPEDAEIERYCDEAKSALQSQSARIAELDALLERCARGFEKHARHWRASQARTDSLEDSVRAKNADALADLARSSLTKDSTSVTG